MRPRLALLVALVLPGAAAPQPARDSVPELPAGDPLARETARLGAELELVRGEGFYLRLDARTRKLHLLLEGVPLAEYPVARVERGTPRLLFIPRPTAAGWELRAHRGGRLQPERERDRLEVEAPASGDGQPDPTPPPIPLTAEEAYSVPARYRIAFEGGVAIEVAARGGGRNRSLPRRLADAAASRAAELWNALRPEPAERVRLRLELDAESAAALYRGLPPDLGLVVAGIPAS